MAVWTVAAEQGTGGDRLSAALAAAADVELLDRDALAVLAHELNPEITDGATIDELERTVGSPGITLLALGIPFSPLAGELVRDLQLHHALPALGRAVLDRAAHEPCVIYAPAAFAALAGHAGPVHVRLRAPLEWRIAQHARERFLSRRAAEKEVREDDRRKHAWVRSIYHVEIDDPRHYSLVLDASRFPLERQVETLLAAAGVVLARPALLE
jgi:hypothetical protein